MKPTDNDGSPANSTAPSSGPVWTPEEIEEFDRIFVASLQEGIRRNEAGLKRKPTPSEISWGENQGPERQR